MPWLRVLLAIALRTPGSSVRLVTRLLAGRSENGDVLEISTVIFMSIVAVGHTQLLIRTCCRPHSASYPYLL